MEMIMAIKLLTLAITETKPRTGEFHVIALEMDSKTIIAINLQKEEIVSKSGVIYWDIGYITIVEDCRLISPGQKNKVYKSSGTQLGENYLKNLSGLLDSMSKSGPEFFQNTNKTFAVVKVKNLRNITNEITQDVFKSRISVEIAGVDKVQTLLNKDYRWLKYWQWVLKNGSYKKKIEGYLRLANNSDKTIYLILYRFTFPNNQNHWIVGVHWTRR